MWFSKKLKEKVIYKKILHQQFKETNSPFFHNQFCQLRQECKSIAHVDYKKYIERTEKLLAKNPRKFYEYVRSKK